MLVQDIDPPLARTSGTASAQQTNRYLCAPDQHSTKREARRQGDDSSVTVESASKAARNLPTQGGYNPAAAKCADEELEHKRDSNQES